VNPTYFTQIIETIHDDEFYNFFGNILTTSGVYLHTLNTIYGCDSIIELTLTVEARNYTISAIAGVSGTITPSGTITVVPGDDLSFTFAANSGYSIYQLIVDGVNVDDSIAGGSYTFTNITANHFIAVSFIKEGECPDNVIDVEGNIYAVTSLAGKCWTENMRTRTYPDGTSISGVKAYNSTQYPDSDANADIFGLLYDWYAATGIVTSLAGSFMGSLAGSLAEVQGICPNDWHIPSREEWLLLAPYSAKQLKSTTCWVTPGTDDYNFTALGAGMYDGATNRFIDLYGATGFWSSTSASDAMAYSFFLNYYCENLTEVVTPIPDGLSVRCVMK
jgi:uncharacterized protein (TIGR02145 family)